MWKELKKEAVLRPYFDYMENFRGLFVEEAIEEVNVGRNGVRDNHRARRIEENNALIATRRAISTAINIRNQVRGCGF